MPKFKSEDYAPILGSLFTPFSVELNLMHSTYDLNAHLVFTLNVPAYSSKNLVSLDSTRSELMGHFINSFNACIRETQIYREDIEDKDKQIKLLNETVEALQKENGKLAQYKTHYRLEKELRHNNRGDNDAN